MSGGSSVLGSAGLTLLLVSFSTLVTVGAPAATTPGSTLTAHGPILIDGDANFTATNGVTSGTGVPGDPYTIQGWDISAAASNAISIRSTTASFAIRDVRVHSGGPSFDGIVLERVSNAWIENVTADSNRNGVLVDRSNSVSVTSSTLGNNNQNGFAASNSLNLQIETNWVTGGAQGGIYMDGIADATIRSNHISGAFYGLWISGSPRATVSGNEATGNVVGVYLGPVTSGVVSNNTLAQNSDKGLAADLAGPVDLTWNNVSTNGHYGFYLNHWNGRMHDNTFFQGQKGWDVDANEWDGGYPTGGNWWYDNQGLDRCSGTGQDVCPDPDGFVDAPVFMDGGGVAVDRYPRVLTALPPPPVLIEYSHPTGFRLPVPQDWAREENQVISGRTIELLLFGPTYSSVQTNILVDTASDPAVHETSSYLLNLVNITVAAIQRNFTSGTIQIVEGPTLRTISNHTGVSFKLLYGTTGLFQTLAVVVSEALARYWVLIQTTDALGDRVLNGTFEQMINGFVITAVPPTNARSLPWVVFGIMGAAVAIGALVVVLLMVRRRRSRYAPPVYLPLSPVPTTPSIGVDVRASVRFCPNCGAPNGAAGQFCGRCGLRIPGSTSDRVGPAGGPEVGKGHPR